MANMYERPLACPWLPVCQARNVHGRDQGDEVHLQHKLVQMTKGIYIPAKLTPEPIPSAKACNVIDNMKLTVRRLQVGWIAGTMTEEAFFRPPAAAPLRGVPRAEVELLADRFELGAVGASSTASS